MAEIEETSFNSDVSCEIRTVPPLFLHTTCIVLVCLGNPFLIYTRRRYDTFQPPLALHVHSPKSRTSIPLIHLDEHLHSVGHLEVHYSPFGHRSNLSRT